MQVMTRRDRRVAIAIVALATGCSANAGSSSGSGAGGAGGSSTTSSATSSSVGGYSECVDTPSVVPSSEVSELGFSADDVLAAVGGMHATQLTWISGGLYAQHTRGGTTTELALDFGSPDEVRFILSEGGGCPQGGEAPCIVCDSRMEIDLQLGITTADGSLDESLPITVEAMSIDQPWFRAELAADQVMGAYFEGVEPEVDYQIVGLHVAAFFDSPFSGSKVTVPDEWNGFVAAVLAQADSSQGVLQAHGYFPPETAGTP
jgi:hypothetical protein